ncbi:MAG: XdhC family protein [Anaerolineae bacterium]
MEQVYRAAAEALQQGAAVALATIVQVKGSAPRSTGAQMLIGPGERVLGTIGGGSLEAQVVCDAQALLAEGRSALRDYALHPEFPETLGICGGHVQVFIHVLLPAQTLLIAGAGHVAQALARLAAGAQMGLRVLVADDRADLLTAERFPGAETRRLAMDGLAQHLPPHPQMLLVIATRSHQNDETVLRQYVGRDLAYLGMIGSRQKVRSLVERLRHEGVPDEALARLHAPIGLDIGAETPEEIAVAILAEIIQARRGGTGRPLCQVDQ